MATPITQRKKEYNLVMKNSYNRLYRRKETKPNLRFWQEETTGLTIDFGQTSVEAKMGISVNVDTLYQGQGYGWVTDTQRQLFTSPQRRDQTDLDGICSNQDGVFRVDLPNGRYIVTSTHCNQEQPSKIDCTLFFQFPFDARGYAELPDNRQLDFSGDRQLENDRYQLRSC